MKNANKRYLRCTCSRSYVVHVGWRLVWGGEGGGSRSYVFYVGCREVGSQSHANVVWRGGGRTRRRPDAPRRGLALTNRAHVKNTMLAKMGGFIVGTPVLKMGRGVPPHRKLTIEEAFAKPRFQTPKAAPCKREQRGGSPYASRKPPRCHASRICAGLVLLFLVLCFVLFGVGGCEGPLGTSKSAGELKIDSERVQKTGKQRFGRRE